MDAGLLAKLFGTDGRWRGPCTVILDSEATVQATGTDSIVQGGVKMFAPRLITGRVAADAVLMMPDRSALLIVRREVIRQQTGEDIVKQSLWVTDPAHVAAVEFADLGSLSALGVTPPGK